MKYIIKFSKEEYMKYISHLDLLRLFKRAFKKASIGLVHSQGFNPHPKMTFGQPLSLGYTSTCELLEIETKENLKTDILKDLLQQMLPKDIKIISCDKLEPGEKSPLKELSEAIYIIHIENTEKILVDDINSVLSQDKIITFKKQKKKRDLKEIDIKPLITKIEVESVDDKIIMTTTLPCGSVANLNPELILKAIREQLKVAIPQENVEIKRIALQ